MNFKKLLFAVFAVSFIFTSCKKSADLTDAIPADATYVMHFDMQTLIQKSEYDIFKNPTVQQGINMYKAFMKDPDKIKLLDNFLEDPNSIGLDVKNDLYFYTNYQTYGILLGVNDAGKLKNAILQFAPIAETDIQVNGDVNIISPERMVTFAWNDDKFILIFDMSFAYTRNSGADPVNTSELAIAQLNQEKDKSINSIESFAKFNSAKKDISLFYNMEGMKNLSQLYDMAGLPSEMLTPYNEIISDLKGLSMGMFTSFEKGEITATYDYYYDTPETEKRFKELASTTSGTLKGEQLGYITPDPIFFITTNLKGAGVYDYFDKMGLINLFMEEYGDAVSAETLKKVASDIDGDVTFALNAINELEINIESEYYGNYTTEATIPECLFFADIKDPEFYKTNIKKMLDESGIKYEEIAPGVYSARLEGVKVYVGVNNNTLFATNIESVFNNLNNSGLKNNFASQSKDKAMLMAGNIGVLKTYMESDPQMQPAANFIGQFGKFHFTTSLENSNGDAKVEMTNKDKNSLAVICQYFDAMINDLSKGARF